MSLCPTHATGYSPSCPDCTSRHGGRTAVRVSSYAKKDGTQVRAYTQKRDSAEAKEKWDTRKWQAATAGISALAAGALLVEVGFTLVTVLVMVALAGGNWLLNEALHPKPKPVRRTKRRMSGATARRRTTRARRRR